MSTMREDILRTTKSCTGPLASESPKSSFPSRSSVSSTFAAGRWSTGRWWLAGHGRNAVTILIARGLVVEALRDEELGDLLAGDEVADDVSNHDICVERNDAHHVVTIRLKGTGRRIPMDRPSFLENQNITRPAGMTHQSVGQISSCNDEQNPNLLMYVRGYPTEGFGYLLTQ